MSSQYRITANIQFSRPNPDGSPDPILASASISPWVIDADSPNEAIEKLSSGSGIKSGDIKLIPGDSETTMTYVSIKAELEVAA